MKVKVKIDGEDAADIEIPVYIYTHNERVKRSAKIFATLFAISLFTVFIPVLHFVLVPVFLIAAVVMAIFIFKQTGGVDLTELNCPSCNKPMNEKIQPLKGSANLIRLFCYECRKNISLRL